MKGRWDRKNEAQENNRGHRDRLRLCAVDQDVRCIPPAPPRFWEKGSLLLSRAP